MTMSWKRRIIGSGFGSCVGWPDCRSGARGALFGRLDRARSVGTAGWTDSVDRDRVEELTDDASGLDVVDRRAGLDDQAMGERRLGEGLDVVGNDVVATEQAGQRLTRPGQRERATRGGTEVHVALRPGGPDEADEVL